MPHIEIRPLASCPGHIELRARWNYEEWGSATGWSLEETRAGLKEVIEPGSGEEAYIAFHHEQAVGFALLIDCDLKSHAHLKPWLASLYVDQTARRKGIGKALVAQIEETARQRGDSELFLFTATPAYYRPLGWRFFERFEKDGQSFEIMSKALCV